MGKVLPGTLDLLILRALLQGARHGYAIAEFILAHSEGELEVEEGALYPALHRLEAQGYLASAWGLSENNRRAKFYRLTAIGRRQLEQSVSAWQRAARAIAGVLEAKA